MPRCIFLNLTATCSFFARVDRVLRRSLGVSEHAKADTTVKPAPPIDPELPSDDFEMPEFEDWSTLKERLANEKADSKPQINLPPEMAEHVKIELEEILDDNEPVTAHDEL